MTTIRQSANEAVAAAARRASLVFTTELWTYSEGEEDVIPGKALLKDTILDLIHHMSESDNISTGRISIEKDELVGYAIHLEIGSLSQEEMDALDKVPKNVLKRALETLDNYEA